jgi:hypothetical protein
MGLTPVYSSAALFIRPENLSLQQSTINLHACLSLGAEPSCSRPPWVKLNRFSPTLPQSGALINVWGTVDMKGHKKSHLALPSVETLRIRPRARVELSGFITLLSTATGLILTETQKGCQEPRSKGT